MQRRPWLAHLAQFLAIQTLCCGQALLSAAQPPEPPSTNSTPTVPIIDMDDAGRIIKPAVLNQVISQVQQQQPTHIVLFAHGWNTTRTGAKESYEAVLNHVRQFRSANGDQPNEKLLAIGVHWPSLAWDDQSREVLDTQGADLTQAICQVLPPTNSPETYVSDVARLREILVSEPDQLTAEDREFVLEVFRKYTLPALEPEDQSVFDADADAASDPAGDLQLLGDALSDEPVKDTFRVFTFWQMKKRAGIVGRNGGRIVLDRVLQAAPNAKIYLVGHSFGGKFWMSSLLRGTPARPLDGVVLLQPAFSAYALSANVPDLNQPGGYRHLVDPRTIRGPLVITYSSDDWPLNKGYPWGAWIAGDRGELELAATSPYSAMGGVGVLGETVPRFDNPLLNVNQSYSSVRSIWNLNGQQFIHGHSDYRTPPVGWLISSVLSWTADTGPSAADTTAENENAAINALEPPEPPLQFELPQIGLALIEVDRFVRAAEARNRFDVRGRGLTVAVVDSGLRETHVDFAGRVVARRNFSTQSTPDDVTDTNGHGTNVAGIIAANDLHTGIAPEARIVPVKVFPGGSFAALNNALQWIIQNRENLGITVVNMSLGDTRNFNSDENLSGDNDFLALRDKINQLRAARVAVVVAAGNGYFRFSADQPTQGMSYPAILRSTVSVGALYDTDLSPSVAGEPIFAYRDGAKAFRVFAGRLTPFSQRLAENANSNSYTDILAPGAPVTSAGILNDQAESVQHGTSQAAPVISGAVLLLQERYRTLTSRLPGSDGGVLPTVDQLEHWLRSGGITVIDNEEPPDGEPVDNVKGTNAQFLRLDMIGALEQLDTDFQRDVLEMQRQSLNAQARIEDLEPESLSPTFQLITPQR